ncbi:MAG: thioredoxin family protein [Candidatus Omnitrophica bacterium]|nr:thioredoxin family protein [Candidatus Omnitrophota bacterium]
MALKLGHTAPPFSLPGVDGRSYSLNSFSDAPAIVVIFMCNHCPYVKATIDRIIALSRDYADRGVAVVGINSNETINHPEDSFDNMKRWAAQKEFNFPYLRDETQQVARAYGAERTPHIFLFDHERTLRYTGAIDDNTQEPSKVKRRYLREAIDAILAKKAPKEAETHAIGCSIKWA